MPSHEHRCVAQAMSSAMGGEAVTPAQVHSFLAALQRLGFELTPVKGHDEEDN